MKGWHQQLKMRYSSIKIFISAVNQVVMLCFFLYKEDFPNQLFKNQNKKLIGLSFSVQV